MLRQTPFHARTAPLCQSHAWRRWAGYVVASSYELLHEREYHCIRATAALFDISPLFKYSIRGRDAARLLDRVTTRDVSRSHAGQVLYTGWCDGAGKLLDDGTVARLAEDAFLMTAADPNLRWLQDNTLGLEVEVADISESIGALSLQGPQSRQILEALGTLPSLKYFRRGETKLRGIPVSVSRTGYTGDLGYEIWVSRDSALALWDALMDAGRHHGIMPAGMLALDTARIEAGLMLLDVDYVSARRALIESQTSSPYEMDLAWTVDLSKPSFVGRRSLEEEARRGPQWRFVGVEIDWDSLERLYAEAGLATRVPQAAWRTSVPLYAAGEQVGYATSGAWSPVLKKYIALAHLRAEWAGIGSTLEMEITVEHRRCRAAARVVKKPFFDPERKRK
jgi:aminomethyltransferase